MKVNRSLVNYKNYIVLFIFNIISCACLYAQNPNEKIQLDSLSHIIKQTKNPTDKISSLKKIVNIYWQLPEEVTYLKQIIDISIQSDTIKTAYESMSNLCRYYYNAEKKDSLLFWIKQIDSLSSKRKEYPDALFIAGNILCKQYLSEGNYELAMNEAIRQLNLATYTHQEYGLMKANQNLGLIYQTENRDSDAVVAYREGMVWLKKNVNNPSFELQYLSEMVVSCIRLNYFEESEELLKQYEQLLEEQEEIYKAFGSTFSVKWHRLWIDSFYAELYTRNNQLDKAQIYLGKAALAANKNMDESVKYPYYLAEALYYKKTGQNQQALRAINKVLSIDDKPDLLKLKVDILRADGKWKEAIAIYDKVLVMNININNEAFSRQINQLRSLNDLNDKDRQTLDLQYQNEQISLKQKQLIVSMFFSLVLLVLLYILFRTFKRTRHLRNELLYEKVSLVNSEKELRLAKEEAELANRMKTAFIANISHEVRTPLNAIVGFSELLAEGAYDENDKKEFSTMINNNTELLLTLVNDVLDLSRLESGNVKFAIKPCPLVSCCQEIITSIERYIAPNVHLTFTPSVDDTYILFTDPFRLQQLLTKLLLNAAKFTIQGEINLSFKIDTEQKKIHLIVTDTGCGIPFEKQKKIFERFEKLNEFVQGTGLGLPICLMIARKFGGNLFIDSTYTQGARFIFTHPLGLKS